MSAVVVADGDQALADALRDELLAMCWAARADFVYNPEPLSESIARARASIRHCRSSASLIESTLTWSYVRNRSEQFSVAANLPKDLPNRQRQPVSKSSNFVADCWTGERARDNARNARRRERARARARALVRTRSRRRRRSGRRPASR